MMNNQIYISNNSMVGVCSHKGHANPIPEGLWKARNRAGGLFGPTQISKTTNRSDKPQAAFDRPLKDLQLS